MKRLLAEWISAADEDSSGHLEYKYARSHAGHSGDLEKAKSMAVSGGKSANVAEWAAVSLQEWAGEVRNGCWITRERWLGDWSGNWQHEIHEVAA